jgi:hypothetical protein
MRLIRMKDGEIDFAILASTTNAEMALQEIIPEVSGLCPEIVIDGPLLWTRWCEA